MIKELLLKLWQWLKDQTELDEKIEEEVNEIVDQYNESKERFDKLKDDFEERVDRVKEEVVDVVGAIKEVKNQVDDVTKAVGGSKRKGRKPVKVTKTSLRELKKEDLIKKAKKEFKVTLDSKLTKSNLVNKVYELYHKK